MPQCTDVLGIQDHIVGGQREANRLGNTLTLSCDGFKTFRDRSIKILFSTSATHPGRYMIDRDRLTVKVKPGTDLSLPCSRTRAHCRSSAYSVSNTVSTLTPNPAHSTEVATCPRAKTPCAVYAVPSRRNTVMVSQGHAVFRAWLRSPPPLRLTITHNVRELWERRKGQIEDNEERSRGQHTWRPRGGRTMHTHTFWAARVAAGTVWPDTRRAARLACILATFAERPSEALPQAAGSWGQAKGISRFLANPRVSPRGLAAGAHP